MPANNTGTVSEASEAASEESEYEEEVVGDEDDDVEDEELVVPAKTSAKSVSRSGSRPVSKSGSKSGSKSAAPTVTTTTTAHGTVDPDALPAVDKLNIVGSRAASLKARTDLVEWFTAPRRLGRNTAPRTTAEDVHYVRSAFIALSGRTPSAKVAAGYAAQLSSGQTRVKVVEDIALSINPNPRFWNR